MERSVRGGETRRAAVDDAVEAGRAAAAGGGPLERPAGLQVTAVVEDDDVLAEHVAVEGDRAGLVVVADRPTVLHDAVLADDAVAGRQRRGGEPGDRAGIAEELDRGQLADEGQPSGIMRCRLGRGGPGGTAR